MRQHILFFVIFIAIFGFTLSVGAQTSSNQRIILQGGIEKNVPKTPAEITDYLKKMNLIMKEYDQLSQQLMLVLMTGNQSAQTATNARNQWIILAKKIETTIPPAELKSPHLQLASSLRRTSQFLQSIQGANASQKQQILSSLTPVVLDLSKATSSYSNGVNLVINQYGLDPSLNPLGTNGSINAGGLGLGSGINLNGINLQDLGF
jgi:hypothetical protein